MKDKEKQNISMKEMLTKRSIEPITNCNCKVESRIDYAVRKSEDKEGAFADLLNQEIEELQKANAIVEMQNVVCKRLCNQDCRLCNYYNKNECIQKANVDALYEQGYRKITDSVVLSREEYEKLTAPRLFIKPRELNQKELAEKLKNEKYGIIGVDESIIEIIPTRQEIEKETAEKIFEILYQWLDLEEIEKYGFVTIQKFDFLRKFREILKQFGVEIKE